MLEQLYTIDWAKLKHAYGSAAGVPGDIWGLISPDAKEREQALYNLYGNIFHQGTRYEATPYAIPFLLELIESEFTENKHEIISLLVNLALGYEEEYLPEGINPEQFRKELMEMDANMTDEQRINAEKYGYSPTALIYCYDFVKKGIPVLLKCLKNEDENVRKAAVYAISWFPEEAEITVPPILEALSKIEGEIEIANAVLGVGLLSKQSSKSVDLSSVYPYLKSDLELVRICSAIAFAKNPMEEKVLEILIEGIKSDANLNYVEGMLFNEGRISGYAGTTLSKYGKSEKEKIIPVLCQVLESVNAYQSLDITASILSILNEKRTKPIKEEKAEDLDSLEIMALNAICEHGGWTIGTSGFVNYFQLLRSAGIPDSKEKLKKFLNNEPE
ncbi:MAG: HEAT repeat domain-containing protein [Bacteroidia bacterium]|nr:HEAT repeat domain-containing protein [Bacteroidia bacterium]